MSEDSERFRLRAKQCRELAATARDDEARRTLSEMAVELDDEADKIDREERLKKVAKAKAAEQKTPQASAEARCGRRAVRGPKARNDVRGDDREQP